MEVAKAKTKARKPTKLQTLTGIDSMRVPAMRQLKGKFENPNIIEIGAAREFTTKSYEMDGLISLHLLDLLDDGGELWSVDIDEYTIFALEKIYVGYNAHAICQDGEEFLKKFSCPIDILVLDANDVWTPDYKAAHKNMYLAARDKFSDNAMLVLDDVFPIDGLGKPELLLELAIEDGFQYLTQGYTVVMQRR